MRKPFFGVCIRQSQRCGGITSWIVLMLGMIVFAIGCDQEADNDEDISSVLSKVYVADEQGGTISVIDTAKNKTMATINLSVDSHGSTQKFSPHNVQAAPDGKSVWVTAPPGGGHAHEGGEAEQVIVIDPFKDKVKKRIALGSDLHLAHVVIDSESRFAYVSANETSQVYQLDAQSYEIAQVFDLPTQSGPHGMRVCDGKLYIANLGAKGMSILDPATGDMAHIPLAGMAVQTACVPGTSYVFVSLYDTREVIRYNTETQEVVRIALPEGAQGPIQMYPSPDGATMFVCDQGLLLDRPASNKLYQVDVATATVQTTIDVGTGAHGVVVSEDGAWVYVTNTGEATVSVVDVALGKTIAAIPVGKAPNGISHWHGTGGMP